MFSWWLYDSVSGEGIRSWYNNACDMKSEEFIKFQSADSLTGALESTLACLVYSGFGSLY